MQNTKKLTLGALLATIFAVTAFMFKGFVIVPGITEIRPVNAYPIIFGLLFGSLGAWACAIGNFIGDLLGGTLTFASVGGFIGNYAMAYIPYMLWRNLKRQSGEDFFIFNKMTDYAFWLILCFFSSITAALVIPIFADVIGVISFGILSVIIFTNNFVAQLFLGTIIYVALIQSKFKNIVKQKMQGINISLNQNVNRSRSFIMIGVLVLAFVLGVLFVMIYPKNTGQIQILMPMSILSLAMVVLMKE